MSQGLKQLAIFSVMCASVKTTLNYHEKSWCKTTATQTYIPYLENSYAWAPSCLRVCLISNGTQYSHHCWHSGIELFRMRSSLNFVVKLWRAMEESGTVQYQSSSSARDLLGMCRIAIQSRYAHSTQRYSILNSHATFLWHCVFQLII